jgi:hypothetical protein
LFEGDSGVPKLLISATEMSADRTEMIDGCMVDLIPYIPTRAASLGKWLWEEGVRIALLFATVVGTGLLAQPAFAETCTSPDDPSCTITCDDGCLAGTGDAGCVTECSDNAAAARQSKVLSGRVSVDVKKLPIAELLKRLATTPK